MNNGKVIRQVEMEIPGVLAAWAEINKHFNDAIDKAAVKHSPLPESDEHGLVECTCGHIGFEKEAARNGECVNCAEDRYQAIKGKLVKLPDGSEGRVTGRDRNDCDSVFVLCVDGQDRVFDAWELSLLNVQGSEVHASQTPVATQKEEN